MNVEETEEIKREFQLERMILFSDAVFAIIITIMVLEMRVPEGIKHADSEHLHEMIIDLARKFGGYIISYFIVGAFWIKHLRLFSYLKDYTFKLIVYNLAFLFFISLFPFAAALLTETFSPRNLNGLYFYFSIVMLALFTQTSLTGYLVSNAKQLCINHANFAIALEWKAQRLNYFALPAMVVFMLVAFLTDLPQQTVTYVFIAWICLLGFIRKKFYPAPQDLNSGPFIAGLFKRKRKK